MKRVIIVHGWDGYPKEGWFPWLKEKLEEKKFQVQVPTMPKTGEPEINLWVSHLSKIAGNVDKNTFFVGHSIGCQAILRYLESLPSGKKVGGSVFVAGWFTLKNLSSSKEWNIAKPRLETPINFEKVKKHTKKFTAIFSDNDDVVPADNKNTFRKKLGAEIILEHKKGHFSESDNVKTLQSALESVFKLSK